MTPEAILDYARRNNLSTICITDHFWDSDVPGASPWYSTQNFEHISQSLPLPRSKHVDFKFGCEAEMDKNLTLGVSRDRFERSEFIVVPTTHLHMMGFTMDPEDDTLEGRAECYERRFRALTKMPLPANKIGIAHLTCPLISKDPWESHLDVLDSIPDETFAKLFTEAERRGFGIELNMPLARYQEKACGCHFYLGSDAHSVKALEGAVDVFREMVDRLDLTEDDKFRPFEK